MSIELVRQEDMTGDNVAITDAGGYFASDDVEGALQEIGSGAVGGAVDSVNGDTGVVVLEAADVGADPVGSAAAAQAAAIAASDPVGSAAAAEAAAEAASVPRPAVDGTAGQVVKITSVGPLVTEWGDGGGGGLPQSGPGTFTESLGDASAAGGYADATGTVIANGGGSNLAFGFAADDGVVNAAEEGTAAFGYARNGSISADADGSVAWGYVRGYDALNTASILNDSYGGLAFGSAKGALSRIETGGKGAQAFGYTTDGGQIVASGNGSLSFGFAYNVDAGTGLIPAKVEAANQGAMAFGYATYGASVIAERRGSLAFGVARYDSALLRASGGQGAVAFGEVTGVNARLSAYAEGAFAFGSVRAAGCVLEATSAAAVAHGYVKGDAYGLNPGSIIASGAASNAFGVASVNGAISATREAALAFGQAVNGGEINSDSPGGLAFGKADGTSARMTASGYGGSFVGGSAKGAGSYIRTAPLSEAGFVFGHAYGGGIIENGSGSYGAVAMGQAYGAGATVTANSSGSFAFGRAEAGFGILADSYGSLAFGSADTGNIQATQDNSVQFFPGVNDLSGSVAIGPSLRLGRDNPGAALRNGDIWIEAGVVYVRSNNATVAL